ncbi:hypothetical protein COHA_004272 [Chlorella ohadii]|uniref:BTB domain-containing protein n=1 Tax=Chlorella ohadii TaxID=2649997 RepID=A0AAD5H318_9CHLO|nr:hypothetical protein COHA_004272 [Chlorella ohadii]
MAASGSGGGGGGHALPPELGAALRHMLAVDEDDYDCTIELVFPPVEFAVETTTVSCRASSVALKQHSEVFRRCIKGWTGGQAQTLRINCEGQQEAEAFQQLLAFVHRAERALPDDPLATQHLLAVARKHGAESCVAACLQLLLMQVDELQLSACLRLVLELDTGASGLGELLSVMFDDHNVKADTEATVLAAFALWADANINCEPEALVHRVWVAAVCSRIRFPEVPPDVLLNYWTSFKWLQAYDPNRDLLLCALATAADAQQRALWQSSMSAPPMDGDEADTFHAQQAKSLFLLWWTPRVPPSLPDSDIDTATFDFQLQIKRPDAPGNCASSEAVYWCGYWWRCEIRKNGDSLGICVRAACTDSLAACVTAASNRLLYRAKVDFSVALQVDGIEVSWDCTRDFAPARTSSFWGVRAIQDSSGQPVPWERFWASNSPFLRNGRAHLKLKLSVPPS